MVKKLKVVFVSLSLLISLIAAADVNDDIQRKQAQDRQQLELEKSLKEQFKLKTKQQVMPRQKIGTNIVDSSKCVNIKQINTSKQNLIDAQLIRDLSKNIKAGVLALSKSTN